MKRNLSSTSRSSTFKTEQGKGVGSVPDNSSLSSNSNSSEEKKNLFNALREKENEEVLWKVVYTTIVMMILPLIIYYISFRIISEFPDYYEDRHTYAGSFAVISVIIIMVGFVIMAFREDKPS